MKKVGIVTSNASFANNYGAVLQCYALCGQLRKWGFDPYVINYSYLTQGVEATTTSLVDRSLFSKIKYLFSHDVSWTQKVQYRMKRSDRQNMRDAFLQFCRTNLSFHSNEPAGYADLKRNPPGYDYYITGSDQVWNPVIHGNRNDEGCFLQFAQPNARRIAYAPSFGICDYPEKLNASLRQYLSTFDAVSVRENEGREIIKRACGADVPIVLDPTLMADPDVYSPISSCDAPFPEKYILCYRFGKMKYATEIINAIAKRMYLPVIELPLSIESYGKGSMLRYDIDPSRFIGAVRGAELVLTDSFHCTVFSILYHVPFYTFMRQPLGEKNNMNGRIECLLQTLEMENRMIAENAGERTYANLELQDRFLNTDRILRELRRKSQNYLRRALDIE